MTALIFSNEEIKDFMQIEPSSIEESGLLVEGVNETLENEIKEEKVGSFAACY